MAEAAPILYLRLGDGTQQAIFPDLYQDLISQIDKKYGTIEMKDAAAVQSMLSSGSLKAILVVDGGFAWAKYTALHIQLARYVQAGGIIIFCCLFSSFIRPSNSNRLWQNFGVPWTSGDYHRSTFYLSQGTKLLFGTQGMTACENEYSMKAVHLKGATSDSKIYVPLEQSRVESRVFPPDPVDQSQSPAVWAKCGNGWLGFIGDVNNEEGSQKLLMVMLVTAIGKSSNAAAQDILYTATKPGCESCGSWEPVKKCRRCRDAQYCSVDCQKADWQSHKDYCRAPAMVSG